MLTLRPALRTPHPGPLCKAERTSGGSRTLRLPKVMPGGVAVAGGCKRQGPTSKDDGAGHMSINK